jgi:hypothetical protein
MLRDVLHNARRNQVAIGHFNIVSGANGRSWEAAKGRCTNFCVVGFTAMAPDGGSGTNDDDLKKATRAVQAVAAVVRARLQLFNSIESIKGSHT